MSALSCPTDPLPPRAGQRLARGVARMLHAMGHAALVEFMPSSGLRVDVISISPKGEVWVVECKSCRADFVSDAKWQGYLEFCDRFFWAVDLDFPDHLLPRESGLIRADSFGAEIQRMAPETRLASARRNRLLRDIARVSSARLLALSDPLGISPEA
ncbi:MAG: MmcB family DNA repair protein [Paracoccus sp. (in: a-proteobacteria)]|uniref:MmcB family DNA repair protein n=1 Tax=Paracoccus sp. TaxID=267 RepID=UPI0039E5610D